MSRCLLLQLLRTSAASVAALSDCYFPNGSAVALSAAHQPCISTKNVFSMCCLLNLTALVGLGLSAASLDTCLLNGMCQPPANAAGFTRDLCTDSTWKSPNCLNVCVGGSDGGSADDTSYLTQCADGSWCCGAKNTTCCNNSQGFQVAKAISPYEAASSSTGTGTTSSPTGTGTGTVSSSQSPQSSSSTHAPVKSSTSGTEIGLGAVLGVVLLAVVVVGIFIFVKKRRSHRALVESGDDVKASYPMKPIQQYSNSNELGTTPASAGIYTAEMDGIGGNGGGNR